MTLKRAVALRHSPHPDFDLRRLRGRQPCLMPQPYPTAEERPPQKHICHSGPGPTQATPQRREWSLAACLPTVVFRNPQAVPGLVVSSINSFVTETGTPPSSVPSTAMAPTDDGLSSIAALVTGRGTQNHGEDCNYHLGSLGRDRIR